MYVPAVVGAPASGVPVAVLPAKYVTVSPVPSSVLPGVLSTPGTTPATVAVAECGLPLYVPPRSDTVRTGVAWLIVKVV